ncbi:sensory rhodopsin transducer [Citricoccus alkalitolerans]|uniref:Sensory rhodopsin transducer n=1 Tax=Citricoccus alkalitolerans TaxID=246603 RepID=A0ABV8XX25_9MICC
MDSQTDPIAGPLTNTREGASIHPEASQRAAHTAWTFPAGLVPATSTGHEPECTSRNVLCLLNATSRDACVRLTVFHEDRDPVGPYEVAVPAQRVKHVRINDLIDPEAVPLGQPYGLAVSSDVPVTAQLLLLDTGGGNYALTALPGFPGPADGGAAAGPG